jgi:hypothetical protein
LNLFAAPDIKPRARGEATVRLRQEDILPPAFDPSRRTRPLRRLFLLALLVVLLGGVIFLVTWEIPPPTAPVETVIPDDRLPR